MWPDCAIYWTLGNFSKPAATISFSKSPTFLGNFVKESKSLIFLVKSFYRNLATFYWSHWSHKLPFFRRTIWSSWLSFINPGTIFANSIICLIKFVSFCAAAIQSWSCDCKKQNRKCIGTWKSRGPALLNGFFCAYHPSVLGSNLCFFVL